MTNNGAVVASTIVSNRRLFVSAAIVFQGVSLLILTVAEVCKMSSRNLDKMPIAAISCPN